MFDLTSLVGYDSSNRCMGERFLVVDTAVDTSLFNIEFP